MTTLIIITFPSLLVKDRQDDEEERITIANDPLSSFRNLSFMEHYLAGYAQEKLGVSFRALRGSGAVNGVSRLHGQVSRRLFTPLFPRWPEDEVPIGFVTNGVHMPKWIRSCEISSREDTARAPIGMIAPGDRRPV